MQRRYHYIDALRVIAILMMFVFHVSMVFVAEWGWHIKNPERSNTLLELNFWMSSFRMPLLFFVSGFISYILVQGMGNQQFIKQRFTRLLIPTLIWTFVLVAPQIYFERILQGSKQSYTEFYFSFLKFEWYPEGDFHWLHLWFIPYLFFYNVASIPVIRMLEKSNGPTRFLTLFFSKSYAPLIVAIITIVPYTLLYENHPASYDLIRDWARHSFFYFFILAGLLFYRFQSSLEVLENNRRTYFFLALLSIILINIIRWNGWEPFQLTPNSTQEYRTYFYLALLNFNSWLWVFCSLAYGRKYLNKASKILTYANTAVYPFYILHQTTIVIIAFYIVQTNDPLSLKFLFLLLVCFVLTVSFYHFLVKPNKLLRFLFGMTVLKPKVHKMEQIKGKDSPSVEQPQPE